MTPTSSLFAAAYLATFVLALGGAARHRRPSRRAARLHLLAGMLFIVGLLQTLNTAFGQAARRVLRQVDLYHSRQPWQIASIIAFVAAVAIAATILEHRGRFLPLIHRAASWLALLLALLCALRIASYHQFDVLLARNVAGAPLGRLVEAAALAGLFVLLGVAICRARTHRHNITGPLALIQY